MTGADLEISEGGFKVDYKGQSLLLIQQCWTEAEELLVTEAVQPG